MVVSEGLKEKRGKAAGDFLTLSISLFAVEPVGRPAVDPVRRLGPLGNEDGAEDEDVGEGLAGKTNSGRGVVDSPYDEETVVDIVCKPHGGQRSEIKLGTHITFPGFCNGYKKAYTVADRDKVRQRY